MDKEQVTELISNKMKLIRTEMGYTQFKMAEVLGMSKKTLVQIEKGRTKASWTNVIAVCALFRSSEVLQSVLGSEPLEIIEIVAHESISRPKQKTMGGKIWWKEVNRKDRFYLQQNLVSLHFRIIDEEGYRWFSTFDRNEAVEHLAELTINK